MKTLFLINNKSKEIAIQFGKSRTNLQSINNEILSLCGYYYSNSLHFYGNGTEYNYDDLLCQNDIILKHYNSLLQQGLTTFGEDLFGNQFCVLEEKYYLLDIETSELKIISNSFHGFLKELEQDIDYYSGFPITQEMDKAKLEMLGTGCRLCPIKPFVIGGEFKLNNLVLEKFDVNFRHNADLAKQLVSLKDGEKVKIVYKSEN